MKVAGPGLSRYDQTEQYFTAVKIDVNEYYSKINFLVREIQIFFLYTPEGIESDLPL